MGDHDSYSDMFNRVLKKIGACFDALSMNGF